MDKYAGKCDKPTQFSQGIAPTATRQTHVSEQFTSLRAEIERYDCLIHRLADRLQCILSDEPPQNLKTPEPPDQQIVPLAYEIRSVMRQLSTSNNILDNIISRIEV